MENSLTKLKNTLKSGGFSVTKARSEVFICLLNHGPLSISEVARKLQKNVDRATVYRTIELFENLGIINRIWHGFKHQIELSEIFAPHHHHAVCQNCGNSTDITSSELESVLATLGKNHRFLTINHSVELFGYCQNCQGR